MPTKLVILRNEHSTYQVYIEMHGAPIEKGDPQGKFVGGKALDLAHLKVALEQHGCSDEMISGILQGLKSSDSVTVEI